MSRMSTSLERHSSNKQNENDDNRDDGKFFEVEKEIWTQMYPHCTNELDDEDELEEAGDEDEDDFLM